MASETSVPWVSILIDVQSSHSTSMCLPNEKDQLDLKISFGWNVQEILDGKLCFTPEILWTLIEVLYEKLSLNPKRLAMPFEKKKKIF